jgi:hypothetical protein
MKAGLAAQSPTVARLTSVPTASMQNNQFCASAIAGHIAGGHHESTYDIHVERDGFSPVYFAHETEGTLMTVPLGCAALSSLCVVIMSFVEYPWFAAAGFVVAYSLFWISLSVRPTS